MTPPTKKFSWPYLSQAIVSMFVNDIFRINEENTAFTAFTNYY